MPSQQVIDRLNELQIELETISSAVKHIDEAAAVAKSTSEITQKMTELLINVKELEDKYHDDILKTHKDKINRIENQLQNLLKTMKEESSNLNYMTEKITKLDKNIFEYFSEIKKIDFPERLGKIDNQISAINIGVGNLHTSIQSTQTKVDNIQSIINSKLLELENKIVENNIIVRKEVNLIKIITIPIGILLIILLLMQIFKIS